MAVSMVLSMVDVCAEITSHLSVKDACVLKRTSKFFYNLFTENAVFVEHITPLFSDGKLFALAGKDAAFPVVARKGWLYKHASPELQADKDFLLAAIKGSHSHVPSILFFAPKKFKADRDVVLAAVTQNGMEIIDADEKFKADKEIVLASVTSDPFAYWSACEDLQKDPDVLEAKEKGLDKNPRLRQSFDWCY